MEAQIAQFTNRGMYQDSSVSKATNEFAFRNYNIRITAVNDNTLLSVTNEKLPLEVMSDNEIKGSYLGHAILNNYLTVFTKSSDADRIYRIEYKEGILEVKLLFEENLGFYSDNVEYIETLTYYESELIQKVYWVDGIHQPRFINIVSENITTDNTQFDFNPSIESFPKCVITKSYSEGGLFPSGVIQYFASYYNKHGAETGIVWSSDLQYITEYNRGEAPDESVNCSFKLNFENLDTRFEYIKVYSLYRTSYNGEVVAQIVANQEVTPELVIIDNNFNNEIIDPSSLFFIGGNNFIAETLTQKDNTLFFGGITSGTEVIPEDIIKALSISLDSNGVYTSPWITFETKTIGNTSKSIVNEFQLKQSEKNVKTFKYGELYRFAIQFQNKNSVWTNPIWIGDVECNIKPEINDGSISVANAVVTFTESQKTLFATYYSNYRLLIAEATNADRKILAQGIVSPTVFNYKDRVDNSGAYALSSWLMRPRNGTAAYDHLIGLGNKAYINSNNRFVFDNLETCEIQNSINKLPTSNINKQSLGYIVSFRFNNNKFEYYIYLATNPYESVTNIQIENIEKPIASGSIIVEGLDSTSYDSILSGTTQLIEEVEQHLGVNNFSPNSDTLATWYQMFYADSTEEAYDYIGVHKTLPGYNYFSSGYFYQHDYSSIIKTTNTETVFGCYGFITTDKITLAGTEEFENNYYVDNSIVTFHSPEINNNESLLDNAELKFKIVGIVPIESIQSDISLSLETPGIREDASLVKPVLFGTKPIINEPMFKDYAWYKNTDGSIIINQSLTTKYYLYLWNKSESIIGQTANWQVDKEYAKLKNKIIANKNISFNTKYYDTSWEVNVKPSLFSSDQVISKTLSLGNKTVIYQGNHETLLSTNIEDSNKKIPSYRVWVSNAKGLNSYENEPQYSPVSIKYKSPSHLVFSFGNKLLPYLSDNNEQNWYDSFTNFYKDDITDLNSDFFPWLENTNGITSNSYIQEGIENITSAIPYFFLGELQREVDYSTLYGGTSHNAIETIRWIPASDAFDINSVIDLTYGDTYYQRYDCLKTYPFTREDKNSVVDITSFMVETHINLLGRYDKHKELDDIINVDNTNFSQINEVYSQPNNFFAYNVLDEKYQNVKHLNQVTYSLNKIPTSDIDTWTSTTLSSAFNLDGSKGKITKLINYNDTIVAFQDRAISAINFNNRTALSTESGVPIEIANSGKVNGYSVIIGDAGCQNKQSICITSSGVYFIDDLNKTFHNFNKEGISNISSKGMSIWFKQNLTSKEKVFYDNLTQDIYITNKDNCLTYNEGLQSFVSFMEYQNIDSIFNLSGNSFMLNKTNNIINCNKMFAGDYTGNYSIEYKINPEPLIDKTFTNIEYIADCIPNDVKIDTVGKTLNLPFDKLNVWNEYQEGITSLTSRHSHPNFERKFRIWRVDVPRDTKEGRGLNRIRNPWMYLKLSKDSNDRDKMVFHNLLVKYYK